MSDKPLLTVTGTQFPVPIPAIIDAEPQPIEVDIGRTAMVVVDMQNAFAAKGGYFDLWNSDLSGVPAAAANIARIGAALRAHKSRVVYVTHIYSPDAHEAGARDSANWYRSGMTRDYYDRPERRPKLPFRGEWGARVIKEIEPQPGDVVIEKIRHSGFYETNLDASLKTIGAKYLLFAGTEMSMCVEATMRDAYYRGYFVLLVTDGAVASAKVPFRREATIYNVRQSLGWVTDTEKVLKALG